MKYGDLVIFGDWGYGPEDDPFGTYTGAKFDFSSQYGDDRLNSQL